MQMNRLLLLTSLAFGASMLPAVSFASESPRVAPVVAGEKTPSPAGVTDDTSDVAPPRDANAIALGRGKNKRPRSGDSGSSGHRSHDKMKGTTNGLKRKSTGLFGK
jgi:hypothetical protein